MIKEQKWVAFILPSFSPMKEFVISEVKSVNVRVYYPKLTLPNRDVFDRANSILETRYIRSMLWRNRLFNFTLPTLLNEEYEFIVVVNLTDLLILKTFYWLGKSKIVLWYGESTAVESHSIKSKIKRWIIRGVCGYACYSTKTSELLHSISPNTPSHVVRQRIGREARELTTKPLISAGTIRITIVSQLIPRKDIDTLLQWIVGNPSIKRKYIVNVIGGGVSYNYLRANYEGKFSNIEINFLGPKRHEQAMTLLKNSHFCFFHTKQDIWGYVTNEALSFGVPVCICAQATSSEIITNGVNGYIYNNYDKERFSEIIGIIDTMDDKEYENLANACIVAYSKFEVENDISDFDVLFEKIRKKSD